MNSRSQNWNPSAESSLPRTADRSMDGASRAVWMLALVVEGKLGQAIEGHAFQVTSRNNTSVSISSPGYSPRPVTCVICSRAIVKSSVDAKDLARVRYLACNGRGGHHERTHQHGASGRTSLPAFEISIARTRAKLVTDQACRDSCPGTLSIQHRAIQSLHPGKFQQGPFSRRSGKHLESQARRWP